MPRLSTRIAVPRVPKLTFYFTGIDMKNMEINAHFAHFVPIPGADCRTFSHIHCQTHTWQLLPRKRLYKKLASFSKLAMLHIHIIMGTYNTRLTTSVLQIFKGAKCCNVAVFRPVTYSLSRSVQKRSDITAGVVTLRQMMESRFDLMVSRRCKQEVCKHRGTGSDAPQ